MARERPLLTAGSAAALQRGLDLLERRPGEADQLAAHHRAFPRRIPGAGAATAACGLYGAVDRAHGACPAHPRPVYASYGPCLARDDDRDPDLRIPRCVADPPAVDRDEPGAALPRRRVPLRRSFRLAPLRPEVVGKTGAALSGFVATISAHACRRSSRAAPGTSRRPRSAPARAACPWCRSSG